MIIENLFYFKIRGDIISNINDVAREAGVSISTVSRVLNNNYPVKKATRQKVEEAIEKLNFKPNLLARGLITGRSHTVGIVVPSISNWFFSTIIEDIQVRLKEHNYHIQLSATGGDSIEELTYLQDLEEGHVDGVIVMDPSYENISSPYYRALTERLPLILIASYTPEISNSFNGIFYDERNGMRKAFERLKEIGRDKIALLRGEDSHSLDIREKLYKELIKEDKRVYSRVLRVKKGNNLAVVKEIKEAVFQLINSEEEMPDAFIACNDLMASALITTLREERIRVPEDVAVIGYDNTPLCYMSYPGITTVDLSTESIGEKAVSELLTLMERPKDKGRSVIINTELILRESS